MIRQLFSKPEKFSMYWRETLAQMNSIGVGSLSIVALISFFIGAVTAVQTAFQLLGSFIPQYYVGFIVRDSMLLELAPTITCLALAGKVGSNVSSEIGTMRISEQIDALEIMGINAKAYLIGPRIIAALITIPLLIILAAFLGIFGGYIAVMASSGIENSTYETGLLIWYKPFYVTIMLVKAAVFAFLITSIACYQGYYVKGGALQLGEASTRAVVAGSTMVLVSDYLLAILLT